MSEHETHADIIAEMRIFKCRDQATGELEVCNSISNYLSDRLEAAHKREIEATAAKCCQLGRLAGYGASEIKHQQEPVGNAAKLREMVVALAYVVTPDQDINITPPEDGWLAWVCAMQKKAREVLAAPARNCDLYATRDDAVSAHKKYCRDYIARASNKFDFPMEFDVWLLATAKEGAAK